MTIAVPDGLKNSFLKEGDSSIGKVAVLRPPKINSSAYSLKGRDCASSSLFNKLFQTSFFQNFAFENPNINKITLHSLHTGIVILSGRHPDQTKYMQIPPLRLKELRLAVKNGADENIWVMTQRIIAEMKHSPLRYCPQPCFSQRLHRRREDYISAIAFFSKMELSYELDDFGVPNNPYGILDVIPAPFDHETDCGCITFIFKGFLKEGWEKLYINFFKTAIECDLFYGELLNEAKLSLTTDRCLSTFLQETILTEMAKPRSFFKEYVIALDEFNGMPAEEAFWDRIAQAIVLK